jgi:hypothetical protein
MCLEIVECPYIMLKGRDDIADTETHNFSGLQKTHFLDN